MQMINMDNTVLPATSQALKAAFQAQLKENGDDAEKVDNMSDAEFLEIVFSFWEKSDLLDILTAVAPHSAPFCYYKEEP